MISKPSYPINRRALAEKTVRNPVGNKSLKCNRFTDGVPHITKSAKIPTLANTIIS